MMPQIIKVVFIYNYKFTNLKKKKIKVHMTKQYLFLKI